MKHPANRYPLQVRWSEEDKAFIGSIPGLLGDCCHGDTEEAVLSQLKEIAEDVVEHLMEEGKELPVAPAASDPSEPEPAVIRATLGMSQVRFAEALGISPKTLHKWEQHTSKPSGAARTLLKIAAFSPGTVSKALAGKTLSPNKGIRNTSSVAGMVLKSQGSRKAR